MGMPYAFCLPLPRIWEESGHEGQIFSANKDTHLPLHTHLHTACLHSCLFALTLAAWTGRASLAPVHCCTLPHLPASQLQWGADKFRGSSCGVGSAGMGRHLLPTRSFGTGPFPVSSPRAVSLLGELNIVPDYLATQPLTPPPPPTAHHHNWRPYALPPHCHCAAPAVVAALPLVFGGCGVTCARLPVRVRYIPMDENLSLVRDAFTALPFSSVPLPIIKNTLFLAHFANIAVLLVDSSTMPRMIAPRIAIAHAFVVTLVPTARWENNLQVGRLHAASVGGRAPGRTGGRPPPPTYRRTWHCV